MLVTVLLFLPFTTCLFWLALNPFIFKRDKPFKLLQMLLAIIGTTSMAQAVFLYGPDSGRLLFFFIWQSLAVLVMPTAILYLQATEGQKLRTPFLAWVTGPLLMIFAEIILFMILGKDRFTYCICNHQGLSIIGQNVGRIELMVHLCSFWLFYILIALEVIPFMATVIRGISSSEKVHPLYYSTPAMIAVFIMIEIFSMFHVTGLAPVAAVLWTILAITMFVYSFSWLFNEDNIPTIKDVVNTSYMLIPDPDAGKKEKERKYVPVSITEVPTTDQTDDYWLKTKFENLIINEQMYLKQGIRISDVATILKTNRTYISKLVNDTYGMSFSDYINTLRIRYAQQYLTEHKDARQSDLAAACGFPDASAFNNVFKRVTGMTPKIWIVTNS